MGRSKRKQPPVPRRAQRKPPAEARGSTPATDALLARTTLRSAKLVEAAAHLKRLFVGIDGVIDQVIDAVRVWYLAPEALTRPVIVNLWGMTGTGKTDLVRKLVAALDMRGKYIEVELHQGEALGATVAGELMMARLHLGEPAIVLFDEIHRFRSLDETSQDVGGAQFADLWSLLSDGQIPRRPNTLLDEYESEYRFRAKRLKTKRKEPEDEILPKRIAEYEARELIRSCELSISLGALLELGYEQIADLLAAERASQRSLDPIDCRRMLVFVTGNLDDAFVAARYTDEADVDADIFYAVTQKVTDIDIKHALSRRFKPEQVARFGNVHVIYRSLRRRDFEALIAREIARVATAIGTQFGVGLHVDESVHRLVYRNGVFPAQGVRPVLSSVGEIVATTLAKVALATLGAGARRPAQVDVSYDEARKQLRAVGGDGKLVLELPFVGRLDQIRNERLGDLTANTAVHEAGHATAYAVLFGLAPLQLTSRVASSTSTGFIFSHTIVDTRDSLLRKIQVLLAGGLAEEIVFGKAHTSTGRQSDRQRATEHAVEYMRLHGFDEQFRAGYGLAEPFTLDPAPTDAEIEKLIARLDSATHDLLEKHRALLLGLADELRRAGELEARAVGEICGRYGIAAAVRPEDYMHVPQYARMLDEVVSGARPRAAAPRPKPRRR